MSLQRIMQVAATAAGAAILKSGAEHLGHAIVKKGLDAAGRATTGALQSANINSYVKGAGSLMLDPRVMIDKRVVMTPHLKDLMNLGQRFLTCYFLLSVAAENRIDGVRIAKRLNKFAPERNLMDAATHFLSDDKSSSYSRESYEYALPRQFNTPGTAVLGTSKPSMESRDNGNVNSSLTSRQITDAVNLAVGQIVEVSIGNQKVPMTIRLRPILVDSDVVVGTLSLRGEDYKLSSRLMRYRVGELSFSELIFQTDRVRNYRKLAMKDKSNWFKNAHKRATGNMLSSILTGQPSVGQMSSIMILDSKSVKEFETKTGKKLDNMDVRQGIMEDGLSMIILVLDMDFQTVTVYIDTIEEGAEYRLSDIKMGGDGDKDNLTDLMTALMGGRISPRL